MRYEVVKTFPTHPAVRRGQVLADPPWRNLGSLVRTGYLRVVEEVVEAVAEEAVEEIKPLPVKRKIKK